VGVAVHTWIGRTHAPARPSRTAVRRLRTRRTERERWWSRRLVLAAGVVLTASLVLVWVRLQVVHTGYELSAARQLERKLEQEQRELALEIATLGSPRRLEERARTRLSMRPPAAGEVVSLP
jgi:cell division protein FtsL